MHAIDSQQQRESNYAEKESVRTLERRGWAFFFPFQRANGSRDSGTTASPNLQPESNTPIHHTRKRTELSQTQSKGGYYIQQDETQRRRRRRQGLLPPAPKLQNSEAATPNSKKIHSTEAPEETGSPRDVEDRKEVKKKGRKHREESMAHELLLPALPQRSTTLLWPFRHSQTKRHGRARHGSHNRARHFFTRSRIRTFS
jgi:hypothetical protein